MSGKVLQAWRKLCTGHAGEVWIHGDCEREIEKIGQDRMWAKVNAHMQGRFCVLENLADLNKEQFRYEDDRQIEGRKLKVYAFKGKQLRVYGVIGSVAGNRAFFAASATQKKKDKLDPSDLDRACERLKTVEIEISGATL